MQLRAQRLWVVIAQTGRFGFYLIAVSCTLCPIEMQVCPKVNLKLGVNKAMTTLTLKALAEQLDGVLVGNPDQVVRAVVHPAQAHASEDLALILDKSILPLLSHASIQTALVPLGVDVPNIPNQIQVKRPKVALALLLNIFEKPAYIPAGIHPSAVIDPTAIIEEGVQIGPLCSVGANTRVGKGSRFVANVSVGADVTIGENALFYAGVVVGDRVEIGNRVILQPNAAIGNDGFSFVTAELGSVESARATGQVSAQNNQIIRINSVGTVILEDDVEIGANSCVDRATLGETRIKRSTKIDNLVQIAHNVTIGQNCLFAGQVGIAGSTTVGDRVVMGGQAGLPDHVHIGEDAVIMAQSGVVADVAPKTIMAGSPAVPRRELLYKEMSIKRVKGLGDRVKELTTRLEALEEAQRIAEPV